MSTSLRGCSRTYSAANPNSVLFGSVCPNRVSPAGDRRHHPQDTGIPMFASFSTSYPVNSQFKESLETVPALIGVAPVARRTFACSVRDSAPACPRSCVGVGISWKAWPYHRLSLRLQLHPAVYPLSSLALTLTVLAQRVVWMRNPG